MTLAGANIVEARSWRDADERESAYLISASRGELNVRRLMLQEGTDDGFAGAKVTCALTGPLPVPILKYEVGPSLAIVTLAFTHAFIVSNVKELVMWKNPEISPWPSLTMTFCARKVPNRARADEPSTLTLLKKGPSSTSKVVEKYGRDVESNGTEYPVEV